MMTILRLGLSLPLLLTLGSCCAPVQPPLIRTQLVTLRPPAALLADCPETPLPENGTNGDLLETARMLRLDLRECNKSKERLRQWLDRQEQ